VLRSFAKPGIRMEIHTYMEDIKLKIFSWKKRHHAEDDVCTRRPGLPRCLSSFPLWYVRTSHLLARWGVEVKTVLFRSSVQWLCNAHLQAFYEEMARMIFLPSR
jgi:hypothetical protein